MTKKVILIITAYTLFCIQSCSYKWIRMEALNGKKYWVKEYKDSEKQTAFEDDYIFKNWKRDDIYPKYSGIITSDTTHGSTFIQFDSVRVYLFDGTDRYKSIFTSGLISGQLLYCKMNDSCRPTPGQRLVYKDSGEPVKESLWGWEGHTITIDYFQEIKYLKNKPTQRKFKFWVYPYKSRFNGANDIFLLELTNDTANEQTDMETFIKGSRVTFITRARMMI